MARSECPAGQHWARPERPTTAPALPAVKVSSPDTRRVRTLLELSPTVRSPLVVRGSSTERVEPKLGEG
jgi:hypothetical protein